MTEEMRLACCIEGADLAARFSKGARETRVTKDTKAYVISCQQIAYSYYDQSRWLRFKLIGGEQNYD